MSSHPCYTTPLTTHTHTFRVKTADGRGTKTLRCSVTYSVCMCAPAGKCKWVYFKSAGSQLVTSDFKEEWYPTLKALIDALQAWLDSTYPNGTPSCSQGFSTLNSSSGRHIPRRRGSGHY